MIALRPATPDDAQALLGIYGPYVVTNAVSFESMPPTVKDMHARISAAGDAHPWIVAYDDDSTLVLGYAFAKPTRPGSAYRFSVETACYVAGELEAVTLPGVARDANRDELHPGCQHPDHAAGQSYSAARGIGIPSRRRLSRDQL